jgi:hypothetical protein
VLPNLIVIGAAKSGTTSLHEYLDLHPEISMSREKELNFFLEDANWSRGRQWYERQFESAPVRGESSPAYSAYPLRSGVPKRMAATLSDVRLVYVVRDPIDRIVSHYVHRALAWSYVETIAEALADPIIREWLVKPSCYWLQLEQYFEYFSRERLLILDSDELRAHREETLASVFRFVGVDDSFRTARFALAHNAETGRTKPTGTALRISTALDKALGPARAQVLRERAPRALKARLRQATPPSVLGDTLREELADELRPEVERLRAETGLPLSGWSL